MNDYLHHMYPDENHLKHFPDDAYQDGPEDTRRRRGGHQCSILSHARPGAILLAIAIGFAVSVVIAFTSCSMDKNGTMPIRDERATPENKAKRHKLLHDQHKDFDKAQREFRMP